MQKKILSTVVIMASLFCANSQTVLAQDLDTKIHSATAIKTSSGIEYFLAGALGKPNPKTVAVSKKAQRLSSKDILKSQDQIKSAKKIISQIYNGSEKPSMEWLTKSAIEAEKQRAVIIKDYVNTYYKDKIQNVIIVGMGGNIGTMKLAATSVAKECQGSNLIIAKNGVKFFFIDTMEPSTIISMRALIKNSPESTLICLVSQSGTTFETISLNALLQDEKRIPSKNIIPLIGDKNSAIGAMANKLGYNPLPNKMGDSLFDIPAWNRTGGRWTGNTAEPSVIIALGGGDPVKWFEGYQSTIEDFINKPLNENAMEQCALLDTAYYNNGIKEIFTLIYGNNLSGIIHGLMQNVNESTPSVKNKLGQPFGGGFFHYADLSPKFQHDTMAQITDATQTPMLIRILTVNNNNNAGTPICLNKLFADGILPDALQKRANGMQGLSPAELMDAMAASTGYDAWRLGRPVEFIRIPEISEQTIASLLAEQYLRTMTWGTVNQIDVTREMSFPGYKKAFKDMTEKTDKKTLKQGPAAIFQSFAAKE